MRRLQRFVVGAVDWTTTLPPRTWNYSDVTVGGSRTTASGMQAGYVVRRDAILDLTLRVRETEWADLITFVSAAQTGAVVTWYPDSASVTTFQVYLSAPLAGDALSGVRSDEYPRVMEVALKLRAVSGALAPAFFEDLP